MSTISKGRRTRLKAKKVLERMGYAVYTFPESKFISDAFGVADLLVCGKGQLFMVQVKSSNPYPEKKYKDFTRETKVPLVYMSSIPYKGFEWIIIKNGSYERIEENDVVKHFSNFSS